MKSQMHAERGLFVPITQYNDNALEGVVSIVSRSAGVVILAATLAAIIVQLLGVHA